MDQIEQPANEIKAWRLAHEQLSEAVLAAENRVNQQKLYQRSLLEAICTNITTDGKLAPSSNWDVLSIYQSKGRSKKGKGTKTPASTKKKSTQTKKKSSETTKKSTKTKPRLKMKVKQIKKKEGDLDEDEATKGKPTLKKSKKRTKKERDEDDGDSEEMPFSKIRKIETDPEELIDNEIHTTSTFEDTGGNEILSSHEKDVKQE